MRDPYAIWPPTLKVMLLSLPNSKVSHASTTFCFISWKWSEYKARPHSSAQNSLPVSQINTFTYILVWSYLYLLSSIPTTPDAIQHKLTKPECEWMVRFTPDHYTNLSHSLVDLLCWPPLFFAYSASVIHSLPVDHKSIAYPSSKKGVTSSHRHHH